MGGKNDKPLDECLIIRQLNFVTLFWSLACRQIIMKYRGLKSLFVSGILFFGSVILADDCLKSLASYNAEYSRATNERMMAQQDESAFKARDIFRNKLDSFLENRPLSEIKDFTYHLAWSLKTKRSLEDNVEDFSQIINAQAPKSYADSIVDGHKFLSLQDFNERKTLSAITQFLYIQTVTNSDLDRSKNLLKNLVNCPEYQVFKNHHLN